ncbi:MAG: ABC transporter substrate-binding protein [Pseudorhodoplanes sp.]
MSHSDNGKGFYETGGMSRRRFVGGVAAGVAGVTAGGVLVPSGALAQQQPKKGGRLRLGWYSHGPNDTLDPRKTVTTLDYHRAYQVANTLTRCSRKYKPEPELAESWEASDGGKVWTFKLRKGVTFHNGKTLDAEDVIASLSLHVGPESTSAVKSWFTGVTEMKADGKDVVRITLNAPNADMPMYVSDMHTVIFPAGFKDFDNFVGTGPFVLKSFKPGVGMLVARNPNYFISGRPYVDEVESFGIGESEARTNALLAGNVDYISRVDPRVVELINSRAGFEAAASKTGRHLNFPMMCDRAPTQNADLRKALRLLADRKGMLADVQRGYGMLANDHPIAPTDPYYDASVPQRDFDLDKAKFHLKKAGMENLSLDLHTSETVGGATGPSLAVHFAESAAKAGLTINVKRQPPSNYWGAIWMKQPFHMGHWQPRPTADLMLSLAFLSEAPWNDGRYKNPQVDKLILEARGTLEDGKRKQLYGEVQRMLNEEGGSMIPLFEDWIDAKSKRIQGYESHPLFEGAAGRLAEEVWLA